MPLSATAVIFFLANHSALRDAPGTGFSREGQRWVVIRNRIINSTVRLLVAGVLGVHSFAGCGPTWSEDSEDASVTRER